MQCVFLFLPTEELTGNLVISCPLGMISLLNTAGVAGACGSTSLGNLFVKAMVAAEFPSTANCGLSLAAPHAPRRGRCGSSDLTVTSVLWPGRTTSNRQKPTSVLSRDSPYVDLPGAYQCYDRAPDQFV